MSTRPMLLASLLLVLALAVLSGAPVSAAGLSVTPSSGPAGTVFTFQASGLSGNESVALWLGLPNFTVQGQSGGTADDSGSYTFKVNSAGFAGGTYMQVVHGNQSGHEFSVTFTVSGSGGGTLPPGGVPGLPPGIPPQVPPPSGGSGSQFAGSGFNANESISVWGLFSDGNVRAMPETSADGNGYVTFDIKVDPSWPNGGVLVVAHGNSSGHEVTNQLTIQGGSNSGGAPQIPPGTLPPGYNPPPPGGGSGMHFYGTGFSPNEGIAMWGLFSDGGLRGMPNQAAGGSGILSVDLRSDPSWPNGSALIVAHGMSSGHEVTNQLNIQGGSGGGTLPPSGGPNALDRFSAVGAYVGNDPSGFVPGSCNQTWHKYGIGTMYIGYIGFSPGETVYFWASLPDLSAVGLGAGVADAKGRTILTYTPEANQPAGHYHIIAHGASSGLELCGHYDWIR